MKGRRRARHSKHSFVSAFVSYDVRSLTAIPTLHMSQTCLPSLSLSPALCHHTIVYSIVFSSDKDKCLCFRMQNFLVLMNNFLIRLIIELSELVRRLRTAATGSQREPASRNVNSTAKQSSPCITNSSSTHFERRAAADAAERHAKTNRN
jgi:hypothetical protein